MISITAFIRLAGVVAICLPLSSCVTPDKIDREGIRSVFKAHLPDILGCYKERLKEMPNLEGKIVVSLDIFPGGKAENFHFNETSTTIKDAPMRKCVAQKVPTWTFPEPPNGQTLEISYPFTFSK